MVLPGCSFAEKDGTFSNSERRVQRVRKAIEPVGEARADWEIFQELSNRMGYPMNYQSAEEVFDEIAQVTPSYAGMSYRASGRGGALLALSDCRITPARIYLHKDRFCARQGSVSRHRLSAPRGRAGQ